MHGMGVDRSAAQYRLGTVTLGGGDAMSGGELERSEMVAVTALGKWATLVFHPTAAIAIWK